MKQPKEPKLASSMKMLRWAGWACAALIVVSAWVQAAGQIFLNPYRMETSAERFEKLQKEARDAAPAFAARLKPLQERNLFAPKIIPQPPQATQILGNAAFFHDRWVQVGEEINGAKVIAIDSTSVTLLWEGKEIKQYPFDIRAQGQDTPRGPNGSRPGRTSPEGAARPALRPIPEGFGGFSGRAPWMMSPEEREQMRQRFEQMTPEEREALRNEMRRRFEESGFGRGRRGGGQGPGQ